MNNITLTYNDQITVDFTEDAWFNATEVAKHFGKKANEWLRLDSTKEYISCLEEMLSKRENPASIENQLVKTEKGGNNGGGGSWFHPKLSVPFARWLDVRFAVWCDLQIEKILHPAQYIPTNPKAPRAKLALPGGLTLEQQDLINDAIAERLATLPKEKQGKAAQLIRGALVTKWEFKGVKHGYKNIPSEQFSNAMNFIARLELDGDRYLTLTKDDLEAKVAERIALLPKPDAKEGELLPSSQPQGMMINLTPLDDNNPRRWLAIQSRDCVLSVYSLGDELVLSEADFIAQLERKGYVVVKQEALKTALRRACGEKITIRRNTEMVLKVTEEAYQDSEKAFFATLK